MYVPFRSCVHWETFFEKKKKDSFLIPLSLNLLVGAGQEYFFNLSMI